MHHEAVLAFLNMSGRADWLTEDFLSYRTFIIHSPTGKCPTGQGVYIFARPHEDVLAWEAVYVGETSDFTQRLPRHERWGEAVRLGATHIHVAATASEKDRLELEQKLIRACKPPLNTQHRSEPV